jgi:peroxiredoxin
MSLVILCGRRYTSFRMPFANESCTFHKTTGLTMETADFGGVRSQRYAMIVENGVVTLLNVEAPKTFEVSKAEVMLEAL